MTADELETSMDLIVMQARSAMLLARGIDLVVLEETFRRAIDFGPFVDPTAWISGHKNAEASLELVHAYRKFVEVAQKLTPKDAG